MSNDFHRPTLTFPKGAYNASQVRLYGTPGSGDLIYPGNPKVTGSKTINVSANISTGTLAEDKKAHEEINKYIKEKKGARNVPNMDIFKEIVRSPHIPWPNPIGVSYQITLDMRKLGNVVLTTVIMGEEAVKKGKILSCGIIVGYSYEGHCYDLPKPKIMLIPTFPEEIPHDDCGYDRKNDPAPNAVDRYMLWIVDKLDECVEFEMNQGFIEQLVLDANLPGKRSPTMYASRMMMGHRSGRLSE